MNIERNRAIMGRTEKLFEQPSALSNELDWSSPVPDQDSSIRLIPLSQGKFAIIDAEDFERVSWGRWYVNSSRNTFYAYAKNNGRNVPLHRFILSAEGRNIQVDHIDGDGLNNRRSNLRICTNAQNQQNAKKRKGCASQFKGVTRAKSMWIARIKISGKFKHLGAFSCEIDAARAYDKAALLHFGDFAKTNFPQKDTQ